MSQSLADNFIAVIADLRALEFDINDPMRFAVRGLRSEAEGIIGDALRHAQQLAYSARQLKEDHAAAVKEAAEAAKSNQDTPA